MLADQVKGTFRALIWSTVDSQGASGRQVTQTGATVALGCSADVSDQRSG